MFNTLNVCPYTLKTLKKTKHTYITMILNRLLDLGLIFL